MIKRYNVLLKRDSRGVFEKTILIRTTFNYIVFILSLLLLSVILPLYVINLALSIFFSCISGNLFTRGLVHYFDYEYLGYTSGNNKKEARQIFIESKNQ
jgi:hypothetical protein